MESLPALPATTTQLTLVVHFAGHKNIVIHTTELWDGGNIFDGANFRWREFTIYIYSLTYKNLCSNLRHTTYDDQTKCDKVGATHF